MQRIPGVVLLLTGAAAGAAPQRARAKASAAEAAPDVFGGYSYTRSGEAGLHGWNLVASYPFRDAVSFVADLSGHYGGYAGADLGQHALLVGARWSFLPDTRVRPFAEALVGLARSSTSFSSDALSLSEADTDLAFDVGGGVDYQLDERWSARALLHLRVLTGDGFTDADPRFSIGAVYRFGR